MQFKLILLILIAIITNYQIKANNTKPNQNTKLSLKKHTTNVLTPVTIKPKHNNNKNKPHHKYTIQDLHRILLALTDQNNNNKELRRKKMRIFFISLFCLSIIGLISYYLWIYKRIVKKNSDEFCKITIRNIYKYEQQIIKTINKANFYHFTYKDQSIYLKSSKSNKVYVVEISEDYNLEQYTQTVPCSKNDLEEITKTSVFLNMCKRNSLNIRLDTENAQHSVRSFTLVQKLIKNKTLIKVLYPYP